jgi:predicted outer membrane protein
VRDTHVSGGYHEVVYDESVLKALDKTLIPDAKNPELKALLVKVLPAFEAHLERQEIAGGTQREWCLSMT